MKPPNDWKEFEGVHANTLAVTHIFDGEEVVTGGTDGQVWIATFANASAAEGFVHLAKREKYYVLGIRADSSLPQD